EARRRGQLPARRKRETLHLETASAERAAALDALDQRLISDRERLAELERDADELAELLEELADALADVPADANIPPFAELRGELQMPLSGRVLRAFGAERSGELRWSGWLIEADGGEEVVSIAHGS